MINLESKIIARVKVAKLNNVKEKYIKQKKQTWFKKLLISIKLLVK